MGPLAGRFLLCLGFLHFAISVQSQCQPHPIVVPIQNVSLPNGASVRGISMTIGSNKQNISFFANSDANETYVYGPDGFCDNSKSSEACVTFRGGVYDASASSTDRSIDDQQNGNGPKAKWTEDTLSFGSNISLSSFRFGVPQQDLQGSYISQSHLGLGRNSSLLRALASAGEIGTKAYSVFWGLVGGPADKQTRGSLVLGGLDKSLIADQDANFTAPLYFGSRCGTGMLVTIDNMLLNWPNGTDTSIFLDSKSAAIQACIQPAFAGLITLPYGYYQNFLSLAGGTPPAGQSEARSFGINFWTMLFNPQGVYYGGLTISLQNGISIAIPNTELVVPDPYIALNGAVQTNTSVRDLVVNSLQAENDKDLPVLGRLFLSSAYVMVNQEAGSFSVWQANTAPTTPEIVALDRENNVVNEFCTNLASSTPMPTSPARSSPSSSNTTPPHIEESKLSSGAIGGIVAGAVGGLAILCIIGFLLYRRRVPGGTGTRLMEEAEAHIVDAKLPTYSEMPVGAMELAGAQYNVAELDSRAVNSSRH